MIPNKWTEKKNGGKNALLITADESLQSNVLTVMAYHLHIFIVKVGQADKEMDIVIKPCE
jgi:hypothetical protein